VRADEKLTAFLELERLTANHCASPMLTKSTLNPMR
jgi:hypothetical protein